MGCHISRHLSVHLVALIILGFGLADLAPLVSAQSDPSATPPPTLVDDDDPPPEPVMWGSGETPLAMNAHFATADGCEPCHGGSPEALALRDSLGRDVSPWTLWRSGAHANSARDPFFRAQAAVESIRTTTDEERAEIESSCTKCHAPMSHNSARLDDAALPGLSSALSDPLGLDGVSCTICHATSVDGWEGDEFLDGRLPFATDRQLYGPYRAASGRPMSEHTAFTPRYGPHIRRSALCGSCHTSRIGPEKLLVSSSYLEWRATDPTRRQECQACHFQPSNHRRIARNPLGRDFNLARRTAVGSHGSSGGNAYLLDLLRENADEFEVDAPLQELRRAATAARLTLLDRTAEIEISDIRRDGGTLLFDVRIENRTGHKLPTGYPSRRMWLMVDVRVGGQEVFATGRFDAAGRLVGIDETVLQPHRSVVRNPSDVPIFEAVAAEADGRLTTVLSRATQFVKDNRILPAGWSEGGSDGAATAPIGVGADDSFSAGHDAVRFELDVLEGTRGKAVVIARLFYQSIPPRWIQAHADEQGVPSKQFARITAATPPLPEVMGLRVRFE